MARGTRVVPTERADHGRPHSLPRVDYLATGGTIASVRGEDDSAATPILTAETIANSVAGIDEVAELVTTQFMQRPSPSITSVIARTVSVKFVPVSPSGTG